MHLFVHTNKLQVFCLFYTVSLLTQFFCEATVLQLVYRVRVQWIC